MRIQPYNKADYAVSFYDTFPEFLSGIEKEYGERPALSWFTRRQEENTLTYRELCQQVTALRRAMINKGLVPGTHIAIVSENSADWIISFLAAVSCGGVVVCVDTEQSDDSIRDMIRRSDAKVLFLSPTFLPICISLLGEGPLNDIVLMAGLSSDERVTSISDLYELGRSLMASKPEPPCSVSMDQTAEIVFTSGTTSQSKMVMLSQKAVMQNLCDSSLYVTFYKKVFCSLPFYHAYGLNCAVLNSFLRGAHLYINGDLKTTMRDLHLARPDTMLTVPLMMEALHNQLWLNVEKAGKADSLRKLLKVAAICKKLHLNFRSKTLDQLKEKIVGSLRLIISGGAHLSKEISEEFELFGIQVLQGYGITECAPLISVNCNYVNKLGSVGLPLTSCQVKLVDGEVWAKGPSVMQGYYKDPEQTTEALKDGWFNTGDLGYLDKDGFLYLTGRKKNLIVFKNGKKVSPEKAEDLISAIPMVKEVLVSGTANGVFADDVKLTASIYPDPQRTEGLTSYEILEHLQQDVDKINQKLPSYEQIQLINIREKEFNKTGTKKIKRFAN
ncbi:MAG: AMP-binding protein [Lawsonibacter sp.]